ncbi:DUF4956 domain-containing protein [Candidatus Chrysopegis kryptomonas]|jgi:uncharacterized membrane protein YhiD involved in acid resistance|uniref:DUF4956 domain-containing protein n=1 Tax=Candidatus Chryseopegocella kryptomonas TaxID=1633643 RepID=A0A0P1MLZ9_9BACT|nr:DUF4956 domain-containing protein [Candidatus Chrysopegis kryptomonas]CUS95991.1 protein of unknown function (DUF4956) [Candidatus Chrysopegis kryptomonas]
MIEDLQNIFTISISPVEVIRNLFVAFVCGFIVSVFYKISYRGISYSSTLVNSLIALSMITSVVIMVIGNNLARAFGLVGAMSIIRFRTAIKDTQDIVFIFFALAVGMASGVGLYAVSIVGTLTVGLVMYALSRLNYGMPRRKELLLQFTYEAIDEKEPEYTSVIKSECKDFKLINVKSPRGDLFELSYYIRLKDKSKAGELVRKLSKLPGVKNVSLLADEEGF